MPDIYLGWSRIWIGETDLAGVASETAWQTFGMDLDGRCTNSSTCSAVMNDQACRAPTAQIPYDGSLCRDNTFASLQPVAAAVPEIGKRFGIGEAEFNCNLWHGSYTMVLKLSGYSGQPNDDDVRVDYYVGTGLSRPSPWTCPLDDFRDMYPLWRSSTPWNIDPENLTEAITQEGTLPSSRVADAHAYVRDGYLVATMPDDERIRLAGDGTGFRGFAMKVQKSIWTGELYREQDNTWHIRDGLFAGRVRANDLITSFHEIGLCEGVGLDGIHASVVEYIQQNADVLSDGTNSLDRTCDAMSFGIAFEAAQLTPGTSKPALPIVECCAPGVAIEDCSPECGDGRLNGTEKCDTAIAAGMMGACPTTCAPVDECTPTMRSGEGCATECKPLPITAIGAKDGCCPKGANTTTDEDCDPVCGNNSIERGETCDPKETCPTCTVTDSCLQVAQTGAADSCNLACTISEKTGCAAGDGCCASSCTPAADSDCSSTCGNGKLEANEKCETTGSVTQCPASCDDGVACTQDYASGRRETCNLVCTHLPVIAPQNGDGCCPSGASANNDTDCIAECGNGKQEATEECDDGNKAAGDGCTAECKRESGVDQCLAQLGGRRPECARCNCEKCQDLVLACYAGDNAKDVMLCTDVVRCGLDSGCSSEACYCGTAGVAGCALGLANGACQGPIAAAAGSTFPGDILVRGSDPNYPVGRANALAACARQNCMADCALTTP